MQFSKINKTSFIAGAGSAVLLGAALIPGFAIAQTSAETPGATAEDNGGSIRIECGPGLPGVIGLHASEELASALGVTAEELRTAFAEVRESFAGADLPTDDEEREAHRVEVKSALAGALGVTLEEFDAALEQAKDEVQAAAIARVNEALADGTITQEQADALIKRIESGDRPFGRHGGRGFGGRGFGGGFPGDGFPGGSSPWVTPDA